MVASEGVTMETDGGLLSRELLERALKEPAVARVTAGELALGILFEATVTTTLIVELPRLPFMAPRTVKENESSPEKCVDGE
jgi:hypothetical protein